MKKDPRFTDDDLERWKTWWEIKAPGSSCDCMDYKTMKALLARLEAAEDVCVSADIISRNGGINESGISFGSLKAELDVYLEAWRKACGLQDRSGKCSK
jgi:hypothetical protein